LEVTERAAAKVRALRARTLRQAATQHVFVTGLESDVIEVQVSGKFDRQAIEPAKLRASRGAGVLIPGPFKREQRCRDKIITDYEGKEAWPPAASVVDIVRCCIAFDDPYAMAAMVALLQKEFDVLRVKNRFENDEVVEVSPERIQAEFYAAETSGTDSTDKSATNSEKMYRDINLNLRPKGSEFVVEVQLTLTGISILKKSEQKIYTLARMASAEELLGTFVFSQFVVPQQKADGSPSSAKNSRVIAENGVVLVLDKDGDARFEAIQSEDLELGVRSRSPAVGQAQVLSMAAEDKEERAENAADDDVRALVGRLHRRDNILSRLSCVCCEEERNQASAQPHLQPVV
jgi:hypothetical protein